MDMVVFQDLFDESKGQPIEYKGRQLCVLDIIPLDESAHRFRLTFEQVNSEWRQGVYLNSKKLIEIDGEKLAKRVFLWHKTIPEVVELSLPQKSKELVLANVWDKGYGATDYWTEGAAMYIEEIPGGKRYHCNDGHMDDDLNDLIFTLEELPLKDEER
jgi:hypothetical protein